MGNVEFKVAGFLAACLLTFITVLIVSPPNTYAHPSYIADNSSFYVGDGCSGTLIDKEKKLVLTNYHCLGKYQHPIKDKEGNFVRDEDGNFVKKWVDIPLKQEVYEGNGVFKEYTYSAQISKFDPSVDLALIRVDSLLRDTAYAVPIYNGPELKRGDVVITIGNPLRHIGSIAWGNVNHPYRKLPISGTEFVMIQHDASQSPGSSGGALINTKGELVGVTNAGVPGYEVYLALPYYTVLEFINGEG